METKKTENNLDKTNNVMHDIASLHKKVDTSNDTVKNSIQTVESLISTLKYGVEKKSKECQVEFKELKTKNTQLQETVTEVRRDMKTSKEVISEIEKSLTVLTQQEDFMRPVKTVKPSINDEASISTLTSNKFAELVQDNNDPEITF